MNGEGFAENAPPALPCNSSVILRGICRGHVLSKKPRPEDHSDRSTCGEVCTTPGKRRAKTDLRRRHHGSKQFR